MHGRAPVAARGLLGLAGLAGGVSAAVWLMSGTAVAAQGEPEAARLGWRITWLLAGLAWTAVPYGIAGRAPVEQPAVAGPGGGLELGPTECAVWMTALRSRLFVAAGALGVAVVTVVALTIEPWVWPVVALPLLALALFGETRITVDRRGLRLVAGFLGVPLKRIPLAQIVSASAEHIEPRRWGGWGYRVLPGRSALVLRAGPGLVLHLRDGRRFAATVPDPQTPADLLVTLSRQVGRRGGQPVPQRRRNVTPRLSCPSASQGKPAGWS
jgi:hypothetical protein